MSDSETRRRRRHMLRTKRERKFWCWKRRRRERGGAIPGSATARSSLSHESFSHGLPGKGERSLSQQRGDDGGPRPICAHCGPRSSFGDLRNYEVIDKEGALLEERVQVILNELGKSDARALKARPDQFLEPSLLQELSREGFIKTLWSGSR